MWGGLAWEGSLCLQKTGEMEPPSTCGYRETRHQAQRNWAVMMVLPFSTCCLWAERSQEEGNMLYSYVNVHPLV